MVKLAGKPHLAFPLYFKPLQHHKIVVMKEYQQCLYHTKMIPIGIGIVLRIK